MVGDAPLGYAGKNRLFAMMLDHFLVFFIALLLGKLVPGNGLKAVAIVVFCLGYFIFCEWRFSATPGKAAFGLTIRSLSGEPCTLRGAIWRTVFRLLEVNPALFGAVPGGIAILMSPLKQRLGDRVGNVLVVQKSTRQLSASGNSPSDSPVVAEPIPN